MVLKELGRNRLIIINYYKNGFLESCKGYIQKLNLHDQTIYLKDEKQNVLNIQLSWIHDISAVNR
ncbi:YolD-like family protein [Niallia sp. 03133]|uniref:YolD-like family protein n=1 Tax=Niallia sp. 03133 TaxID=3458060 RepID=UPI004043F656